MAEYLDGMLLDAEQPCEFPLIATFLLSLLNLTAYKCVFYNKGIPGKIRSSTLTRQNI